MELPEQKYSKYSENYSLKSDKKQSFTHESETSTVSSKCICEELDHFVQTYSSVQPRGHGNLFRHRFSSHQEVSHGHFPGLVLNTMKRNCDPACK